MKLLKNKTLRILLLFIIAYLPSQAQVPGFLGNRFSAGYHLQLGTNWLGFGSVGFLNFRHELQFNYVVRRRTVVGLELGYGRLSIPNLSGQEISDPNYGTGSTITNDNGTISNTYVGINAKFYGGISTIAPLGFYFKLKTGMMFSNISLPAYGGLYQNVQPNYLINYPSISNSFSNPYFGIGFGQTRVIARKVLLDIGLDLTWTDFSDYILPLRPIDNSYIYKLIKPSGLAYNAQSYFIAYHIGIEGLFGR